MRIKPNFGKPDSFEDWNKDDPWGCVRIPLVVVVAYFVLSAITRVTSGNGSTLDQIICYGTLFVFVILWILESRKEQKARQQWISSAISTEVAILDRYHSPGREYQINEYGETRYARPRHRLKLRLPNQAVVEVNISESTYAKLEKRNTVRIYYNPEAPLTFSLEEEL